MVEEPIQQAADEAEVNDMDIDESLMSSPPPPEPAPSSTAVQSEPTSLKLPSTTSDVHITPNY